MMYLELCGYLHQVSNESSEIPISGKIFEYKTHPEKNSPKLPLLVQDLGDKICGGRRLDGWYCLLFYD